MYVMIRAVEMGFKNLGFSRPGCDGTVLTSVQRICLDT